ncbi:MAG: regulatory protein RecX [Deferribacterales bacterium]
MFPKRKIRSKTPFEYALRVLARRDFFENEMRAKIAEHFGEEAADETIVKLKDYGYINDGSARKNLIASRLRSGYGKYRIVEELREKGVDADLNDMQDIADERGIDTKAQLAEMVGRYMETKKAKTPYELKQKCIAHFYRKGYSFNEIVDVLADIDNN